MKLKMTILCAVIASVFVVGTLHGIEPEVGPGYMTDSHGAAGACWFLGDMKSLEPAYERDYYGGLD